MMESRDARYRIGDVIGYDLHKICRKLGEGYFGVVYLTYSQLHKRLFALKMLKEEHGGDDKTKELFRKEANIWTELGRHPNFVHVYWVDEIDGRFCIVMEYLPKNEGDLLSLDEYLNKDPPDIAQTLRWAIQCCYALAFAYSKGVYCHRDIRPKNILISSHGDAKIADFGLGSSVGATKPEIESEMTVEQIRRPRSQRELGYAVIAYTSHMPPEWWADPSVCNQRLDIYSFGFTLYRMVNNGKLPFATVEEWVGFHEDGKLPCIESPLSPIIARCVKGNPNERYQSFGELRSDLESLLKSRTGEVIPAPTLKEIDSWEWNNRGWSRIRLNHCADALLDFDQAIEGKPHPVYPLYPMFGESIYPIFAKAWCGKGVCYSTLASVAVNSGNKERARKCRDEAHVAYDNATLFDYDYLQAWFNWGNLYLYFKEYVPAIGCYEEAIRIDPAYSLAWFQKAEAEFDDGQKKAQKSYERFLELADPANEQFQIDRAQEKLNELLKKSSCSDGPPRNTNDSADK
jgi:serine/threonine protein kinase